MRIDIIHQRDPDSSCDIEVWVDGARSNLSQHHRAGEPIHVHEWSFDPGAGYSMDDFEENRQASVDSAPDFLKERIAQIYDEMKPSYEKWSL